MSEEKTYFTYREDLKTDQQREAWDRAVADAEARMSVRTGNVEQLRERIRELEEALQDIVDRIIVPRLRRPPGRRQMTHTSDPSMICIGYEDDTPVFVRRDSAEGEAEVRKRATQSAEIDRLRQRIAGLEGQLKAQAGNAEEEARQNAAELGHLRQRIAELESERDRALCARDAHCKKWLDAEKRVTAYQDRAKVAENERGEARVAQAEHNVERLLAVSRADRAETRLAQVRLDALEEAAQVCDREAAKIDDFNSAGTRGEVMKPAFRHAAAAIRALASDTGERT